MDKPDQQPPHQPLQEQHLSSAQKQTSTVPYDSNPFTICFAGFSNLVTYAKGVFITMLVIGIFNTGVNSVSQFSTPSTDSPSNSPTQELNKAFDTLASTIDRDTITVESDFDSPETYKTSSSIYTDNDPTSAEIILIILFMLGVVVVIGLFAILFSTAYMGFVAAGVVAANEKRTITFGEAFNEVLSRFGVLFIALLISGLRTLGGLLLLIVPGIRAGLRYSSVPHIVMSRKDLSATQSVNLAKSLYNGHLLEVLGILTVGSIIPIIGQSLSASGLGLSLNQITAYKAADLAAPKTHWLNYIGLIIAVFFIFIFTMLTIVIASLS